MRAILRVPKRSVSAVYRDDRWSQEHAFTIRHACSVEIMRFNREQDAITLRDWYIARGYRDLTLDEEECS